HNFGFDWSKTCELISGYYNTTEDSTWADSINTELASVWNVTNTDSSYTMTLQADVNGPGIGIFKNGGNWSETITIDLNTHTYTFISPAVGSAGY
ncbi:MAG TPA: hypothetical protein O0X19_05660, partial [Methanocorpusculum sp.]|nr:hypothetical protein [Methanocorpusculum sp.]HJJ45291.1 hypothetical protein [Methanocorpusculum sp.]